MIQLDGGNDGINTVVPFTDAGYARSRKALRLPFDRLHKINREVGLHPAMGDAAQLLESGRLAIVQGVGYPNPSRSHFRSMAIWQSARMTAEENAVFGWIGRTLDEGRKPADGSPGALYLGSGSLPLALRSRRSVAAAVTRLEESVLSLPRRPAGAEEVGTGGDLASFVRRSTLDAYASSERLAEVLHASDQGARYPATGLAERLRVIARLIKGGGSTRFYYTVQGSYDTHYAQLPHHANLLGELSGALKAFLDDLAAARLAERVLVLCFSEFGRRVQENGSEGTDHGTAGPVLLAGPGVRAGLIGTTPLLLDLQDGDLKMRIDFRRVYASVLEDWLGLPSRPVLGEQFAALSLFRP
jgi:uncharacterized protein (DUF1501 family)